MFKNSLNNTPLFILPNGSPLSKSLFRTHLTTVIKSCSLYPPLSIPANPSELGPVL